MIPYGKSTLALFPKGNYCVAELWQAAAMLLYGTESSLAPLP
jgi:hypothetical protein